MRIFISFLVLLLAFNSLGQKKYKFKKNKISTKPGATWMYWGYNRSFYSKSDIEFVGAGYKFTLQESKASDNPSRSFDQYVNINTLTVPQFNIRAGYYFKNKVAFSVGYDHMKYVFNDNNQVLMSGYITPGIDSLWAGDFDNRAVTTNRNHFHYENSNGLNYIRAELTKSYMLYQTKNRAFVLNGNLSIGAGCLLTIADFNFEQKFSRYKASISGFGLSTHAALRFEFFQHFFIQGELSGGLINLMKVKLRADDPSVYAKHNFWYGQRHLTLGWIFYLKPKNACDDCPSW
jgi:hypothetical protein